MALPLRYRIHGRSHSQIMGWLLVYSAGTPGVECTDNTTLRLDLDNERRPGLVTRGLASAAHEPFVGRLAEKG